MPFVPPPFSVRPPSSAEYDVQRAIRDLQQRVDMLSRFGAIQQTPYQSQVAGGTMPGTRPGERYICFGRIRSDEESGSGSGEGTSGHIDDFPNAGFFDAEGYVAYSFDQVYDDYPWKGIIIPGGLTTRFGPDFTDGVHFAYPLPPYPDFEVGDVVVLIRCGKHWAIVGSARAGMGSGGGAFTIDCGDGNPPRTVVVGNG